uniref:Uncharacterized protein n=1 Tax=Knipowitschia caucasica TaxID=637954 RepID=A0AAV2JXD8_KNICA
MCSSGQRREECAGHCKLSDYTLCASAHALRATGPRALLPPPQSCPVLTPAPSAPSLLMSLSDCVYIFYLIRGLCLQVLNEALGGPQQST